MPLKVTFHLWVLYRYFCPYCSLLETSLYEHTMQYSYTFIQIGSILIIFLVTEVQYSNPTIQKRKMFSPSPSQQSANDSDSWREPPLVLKFYLAHFSEHSWLTPWQQWTAVDGIAACKQGAHREELGREISPTPCDPSPPSWLHFLISQL